MVTADSGGRKLVQHAGGIEGFNNESYRVTTQVDHSSVRSRFLISLQASFTAFPSILVDPE